MQTSLESAIELTPAMRLAALTEQGLAQFIESERRKIMGFFDRFGARLENRIIERVLLNRIRGSFDHQTNPAALSEMLAKYREAYNSGKMATLAVGANRVNQLLPAEGAPSAAAWASNPAGTEGVLLYTAGGGFILPPSSGQIACAERLGEVSACDVLINNHAMAPENPFPAAIDNTIALYQWLREEYPASKIMLGADTAGASVTLGALLQMRDQGAEMPAGLLLFSPWADLSMSGWSYITKSINADSPFRMETAAFCARVYLQETSASNPLASAIYAELDDFPPISIHTSRYDMHFDDALKLVENANRARVQADIKYWDSPRHHLERFNSKEAKKSLLIASQFVQQCLQLPQQRKHG